MPYYKTSQEWLEQSALLLEARPTTTRITTRYSIKPVKPRKRKATDDDGDTQPDDGAAAKPPRGSLVIKTYDPVSGVTLKYRTTKAAEVSRLIYSSLGQLGRGMAALPPAPEEPMPDAPVAEPSGETKTATAVGGSQPQQGSGGGGKKKKKGKK